MAVAELLSWSTTEKPIVRMLADMRVQRGEIDAKRSFTSPMLNNVLGEKFIGHGVIVASKRESAGSDSAFASNQTSFSEIGVVNGVAPG